MKDIKKIRLDDYLVKYRIVVSRNQAQDLIKRGQVKLAQKIVKKPALQIEDTAKQRVQLLNQPYVTRGAYKLEAALEKLNLNIENKLVFDVGAHQGGFTECCLKFGASQVVSIDVGAQQLHPKLLKHPRVIAFTKTDIRNFKWPKDVALPDLIVADLSFISLKLFLNDLKKFCQVQTQVLILAKPQFETQPNYLKKGIVKNEAQRRQILNQLEIYFKEEAWRLLAKTDSKLTGLKGNKERFYLLKPIL